jgi:hypothetical protein
MKRREISPEQWREFFQAFTGQHEGWLIDVDRVEEDLDETIQRWHHDGALRGVQVAESDHGAIELAVDDRRSGHLETELIAAPHRVVLEQTEDDVDVGLEIDAPQSCLFLRFRSPMPSEMVYGIA